jgi:hypothetical protein
VALLASLCRSSLTSGRPPVLPAVVGPGLRAHITLGCAEGVPAVETGRSQLRLLRGRQAGEERFPGGAVHGVEGEGWILVPEGELAVQAVFTAVY